MNKGVIVMKQIIAVGLMLVITACSSVSTGMQNSGGSDALPAGKSDPALQKNIRLSDFGLAPELETTVWLNVDQPLRMENLRGKVVLIEMWTFGCINCKHVIPKLREWHEKYAAEGLVIIGNHYPEFSYEKDLDNLKAAVKDLDIQYAVTQDNDGTTWRSYENRYWPTLYLIDKDGHIRYQHIGEGNYDKTEDVIVQLLADAAG
jgi:thiol-disulfide isomerase/thioredoxin